MNNGIPNINGQEYTWADVKVNIAGTLVTGITGIDYDDDQDIEANYGAGRYPVSVSKGKITTTAKITLFMSEVVAITRQSPNGRLQDLAPFDIVVAYVPVDGNAIVKDVIRNARFKKNIRGWKTGDMKQEVELELIPTHIEWNKK